VAFFVVVDAVRGEPFATLGFLVDGLFGASADEATVMMLVLFTGLHFVAFVILGIVACVLTELTPVPRTILVGALFGLFVQSLVFYLGLAASGAVILEVPGWPVVFAGDVGAGIVLVLSLPRILGDEAPAVPLRDPYMKSLVGEGIVAGLLGAAIVAVWFFILDLAAGQLLYTPAALGSAMLYGAAAADLVIVSPGTVLGYTLFHLAAFTSLGIVVSALLAQARRFPPLLFGLFRLFVVMETFVVFLAAMFGAWIMEELAWWAILAGNLLAAVTMGLFFHWQRPELAEILRARAHWEAGSADPVPRPVRGPSPEHGGS
jgi:hypothetical protein